MIGRRSLRMTCGLAAAIALAFFVLTPTVAHAVLIGDVTVTFEQASIGTFTTVVAAPGSIFGDDAGATEIGTNVLLSGEFIEVGEASLTYRVFGGGDPVSGQPGFFTTGFDADARFVFSNLHFDPASPIIGVTVVLTDVIGVALGSEVTFTDDTVTLNVGSLAVLGPDDNPSNLGTVRLDLQVLPVPEPGTLALLAVGGAVFGVRTLRQLRRR